MKTPRRQSPVESYTFGVSATAGDGQSAHVGAVDRAVEATLKTSVTRQWSLSAPRESDAVQGQITSQEQVSKYVPRCSRPSGLPSVDRSSSVCRVRGDGVKDVRGSPRRRAPARARARGRAPGRTERAATSPYGASRSSSSQNAPVGGLRVERRPTSRRRDGIGRADGAGVEQPLARGEVERLAGRDLHRPDAARRLAATRPRRACGRRARASARCTARHAAAFAVPDVLVDGVARAAVPALHAAAARRRLARSASTRRPRRRSRSRASSIERTAGDPGCPEAQRLDRSRSRRSRGCPSAPPRSARACARRRAPGPGPPPTMSPSDQSSCDAARRPPRR